MAAAAVSIGQVTEPWQLYRRQCRARFRLGRHQPRHHHQHARPLVRQQARHGDQPRAERRELWRHRRRAAAGGRDRQFRVFGRHDRGGDRDGRADGSDHSDFRRTAAGPFECAVAAASADAPSATQIRAQAFRDIGFLSVSIAFALVLFAQVGFIVHLISFLDPVTGRERAAIAVALVDRDGGGRPRAVLDRDRPAQPAAGLGDLVRQSGRGARRSSSTCTTTLR